MSAIHLVVRDGHEELHGRCHASFADAVVAALSADPETIEELDRALERFIAPDEWSYFRGFARHARSERVDVEPFDAGFFVIDLAARLITYESTYSAPGREGHVTYHNGKRATDVEIPYHLAPEWEFADPQSGWDQRAEERRREREFNPPLDARAVLYGRPLLEFIARRCFERFGQKVNDEAVDTQRARADDEVERRLAREIHAQWMLEPRVDLRGRCPRAVMIERRHHLSWDHQDREEQWAMMGECPRGLDSESAAYRYAGFGTNEFVVYYDLVRFLLWSCGTAVQKLQREQGHISAAGMESFVESEIARLEQDRDAWLDSPDLEYDGRTPRSIIENERTRIPEGLMGEEKMVDDDCPLCQMLAASPGPSFWGLDGCNMDEDFAFSMDHDTLEEWEEQRRRDEEFHRQFEEDWKRRQEEKATRPQEPALWRSTYSNPDIGGRPAHVRLFSIGAHLTELLSDLREPVESRDLIDMLQRDWGNILEVSYSKDAASGESMIAPVFDRFYETLDAVASARQELEPKCADLQDRVKRLLAPAAVRDDASEQEDDVPL